MRQPMHPNPEFAKAFVGLLDAMLDGIQAAGPEGIPSGHLYTLLEGKVSLHTYNQIIAAMVAANRITCRNHVLRAVT